MDQIWEYADATGVQRRGIMLGFSEFSGTDVTYRFHRLGDDGAPVTYPNGGRAVDLVSGARLKAARNVTAQWNKGN